MPPAVSDDDMESDGIDEVPAKGKIPTKADEEMEEEDDEEDEDEPDEYRVEKILKHDFSTDGVPLYQIKWLGYDKKSDLTWEPVENLENATDILEAYHKKIGGPPEPPTTKKKGPKGGSGKRSASAAFAESPAVENTTKKRGRKSLGDAPTNGTTPDNKKLPEGSWETLVQRVSSIIEETDPKPTGAKSKSGASLLVLLEWKDGRKTQHPLCTARTKCPQALLTYYESHLVFRTNQQQPADEDATREADEPMTPT